MRSGQNTKYVKSETSNNKLHSDYIKDSLEELHQESIVTCN